VGDTPSKASVKSPGSDGGRLRLKTEGEINSDSAGSREMPGRDESSKNAAPPATPPVSHTFGSAEARMLHTPNEVDDDEEEQEEKVRPVRKHRSHFARDSSSNGPVGIGPASSSRKSHSFVYPAPKPAAVEETLDLEPTGDDDPAVQATASVALGRKIDKLSKLTGRRGSLSEIRPLLESKTVEQARSNAQSLYQVEKLKKRYGDRPIVDGGEVTASPGPADFHTPTYRHPPPMLAIQHEHSYSAEPSPTFGMHIASSPLQQQQTLNHKHRKNREREKEKGKDKDKK